MIEYLLGDRRRLFTPPVFFATGVFYALISAVVALVLFGAQASTAHVLLATIAVSPIIFRAISIAADVLDREPHFVLSVQSWLTGLYFAYLLGAIVGFQTAYALVPEGLRDVLMKEQIEELKLIEGVRAAVSGMFTKESFFWTVLSNNLRVYIIALVLSFLYGTGGVLLLNWNASIIAALFFTKLESGRVHDALASLVNILPHGILEFLGYFMGGISGVLLGVAIIQEGWNVRLLRDVLILVLLGLLFIFLGALIEAGFI